MIDQLPEAEATLGVTFGDRRLLHQAFVHRSYLNENPTFPLGSNERLEFLGDAVLGFIVTTRLYTSFPEMSEGDLTNLRSSLVRAGVLARIAATLGIGKYLYLGRGEEMSGGRSRSSLLARTFESLVGAIYLDRGLETAGAFVQQFFEPEIERLKNEYPTKDHKSRLQELAQSELAQTPVYHTVGSQGPDHAPEFVVQVRLEERVLGEGSGHSKQEAEQASARAALEYWASTQKELK